MENIPFISNIYASFKPNSVLINKVSRAGLVTLEITDDVFNLYDNILNDEPYDVNYYSNKLVLGLDFLYKELGFIESELSDTDNQIISFISNKVDEDSIKNARERISQYKNIASQLPYLLGSEKPTAYLIILQNDEYLWPTGGQIVSFSVINFNNGKLSGIFVSDVKSTDNLLSGHVEPPHALKRYFQKEEWNFKESNWDADFPTSAQKAEWFLEKQLGQSTNGVLAIDYKLIKDLFAENILKSDNFKTLKNYEENKNIAGHIIQPETFLDELIKEVTKINNNQRIKLAIELDSNFGKKHAQLFLDNPKAQRALSELGYAGEIQTPPCKTENCFSDLFGIIEVNFSSDVSNLEIVRQVELKVDFEEGLIKRALLFSFVNTREPDNQNDNTYKSYVRVLANGESGFAPVKINTGVQDIIKSAEVIGLRGHKEAGIYFEVKPSETKTLIFNWESASSLDFTKKGEYLLKTRKQAGKDKESIKISISAPHGNSVGTQEDGGLTQGNTLIYNTELLRDFDARIFW